jgi:hypothetical protein
MAYLLKKHTTVRNVNNDHFVHQEGTVLSDWEVHDFIRDKIKEGSDWYRERFEPLTVSEAYSYRVKATELAGVRTLEGAEVKPPWPDYVGLHPQEIIDRLRDADVSTVRQAKDYERAEGGMSRADIVDFVSVREREPFDGFDQWDVRQILEKFSVSSDPLVKDAIAYEREHKNRPAIVEWDRGIYEGEIQQPAGVNV